MMSSKISVSLKLRLLVLEAAVSSDTLPTFSTLPCRIFHRCITSGILTAASAHNHEVFNNCNTVLIWMIYYRL